MNVTRKFISVLVIVSFLFTSTFVLADYHSPEEKRAESRKETLEIFGIVAGVAVIVGGIILIVYFAKRKKEPIALSSYYPLFTLSDDYRNADRFLSMMNEDKEINIDRFAVLGYRPLLIEPLNVELSARSPNLFLSERYRTVYSSYLPTLPLQPENVMDIQLAMETKRH